MTDTDRTVQVPVSLIERIVDGVGPTRTRAFDELAALISQPTPTADDRNGPPRLGPWPFEGQCESTMTPPGSGHGYRCSRLSGHDGKHGTPAGTQWSEPPRIEDLAPGTTENPDGWPYSTDPANATRCGEAYVGYEGGEGSCEYLPNHSGRHWSARWGSWSL